MRRLVITIFVLSLAGCASPQHGTQLTAAKVGVVAMRLANDKADALYHRRPFESSQPAQFAAGRWFWTDRCGAGMGDYEATVELAADGSTNSVDVKFLDNFNPIP